MTLKVGDRVRILEPAPCAEETRALVGTLGTVARTHHDMTLVRSDGSDEPWNYYHHQLEPAPDFQKRPPCDACGAESCSNPTLRSESKTEDGYYLCSACWVRSYNENREAIAARRTKQEPEFYGTCPAGTPEDPLPDTLPAGVSDGESHDLIALSVGKRYVCADGPGCCWCAADGLDWSRIPRQSASVAQDECSEPRRIERRPFRLGCSHCDRQATRLDGLGRSVCGICQTVEAKLDPYAAIRDDEAAAKTLAHDLERRRSGKAAALKLDFDRGPERRAAVRHASDWDADDADELRVT